MASHEGKGTCHQQTDSSRKLLTWRDGHYDWPSPNPSSKPQELAPNAWRETVQPSVAFLNWVSVLLYTTTNPSKSCGNCTYHLRHSPTLNFYHSVLWVLCDYRNKHRLYRLFPWTVLTSWSLSWRHVACRVKDYVFKYYLDEISSSKGLF